MLQQVILQTTPPVTLNIEAVSPDDIVVIKSISGLDPADADLFMGEFSRAGGYYQGRRAGQRNPVFNLKLNPDYANDIAVSDIREMIYEWFLEPTSFPDSDGLKVVLKDDRKPDRFFVGYTEKIPAPIFEKETNVQVSMMTTEAYLLSDSITSGADAVGWASLPVTYEGSAKTGLEMTFKVKTANAQMVLDINGVKMTLVKAFALNDVIVINTLEGSRKITQNGVDIMATLTSGSKWPLLRKGVNTIKAYGTAEADGKVVMTAYNYRAAWWGI